MHADALETNWEEVAPKDKLSFIIGNPPFIGTIHQNTIQKTNMKKVFHNLNGLGMLDFVTAWYIIAARFIIGSNIKVAFVSTNSISQGLQAGVLWAELFKYNIHIHFAHQTFKWNNEAKGNAAVHCVIIGFGSFNISSKKLFVYDESVSDPSELTVQNINPYLVNARNCLLVNRSSPICNIPKMVKGSQPTDGGHLLLDELERNLLIKDNPISLQYIRRIYTNQLLLNGTARFCLWLKNAKPEDLNKMPLVKERLRLVKNMRLESSKEATRKWAEKPMLFTEDRQPESDYILLPVTTSERRKYIPILFVNKDIIANNSCLLIPNGKLFHFGVVHSQMHMAWVRVVTGRMKSDFQYSNTVVYNNYPWPENPTDKQKEQIEKAAQKVLDARAEFPNSSLADLYDPLTMPPILVKAHNELDKAVDLAYRPQAFTSDANRMEFLFDLYEKYTAGLFAVDKKSKKR